MVNAAVIWREHHWRSHGDRDWSQVNFPQGKALAKSWGRAGEVWSYSWGYSGSNLSMVASWQ